MVGWRDTESIDRQQMTHIMAVKQDIKHLDKWIVQTAIDRALIRVIDKHHLKPEDIDWYLPHYSSGYFRDKFYDRMKEIGFEIPYEKWFTNLYTKGNTGSAAIYIIIEDIFKSGRLKKGQQLLCFIPESGRFSHCYMMLSVV
jgi:3-oxoacyl-[acyl-carrier-protein] synthase-3